MAQITKFQLRESINEIDYQIKRLKRQILINPTKVPPGIKQSFLRFRLIYEMLKQLERDGELTLVDVSEDEIVEQLIR